ncbi:contractile injection system tape measure protein [Mucilaginibacter sp.]|uniref:contractile injection system tape measure protein n=1 Tax=Mucilaginibacter sp. TaxID=1882438 RepID=UPI002623A2F0|nr:contractile injection system tape measure protein [Mucilaginibacter sp.]
MKQVIDLAINEQLDARAIQERVSRLFQQRIIPLIEKYLDRVDLPGSTTQIPLLEIDLGVLTIDTLEEVFEDRFEQEIARLVKKTSSSSISAFDIEGATVTTKNQTDRVLVACFLETGIFPWWVKDGTPALFIQALSSVIREEKHEPIRLLRVLFAEPAAIKRSVYNAGDQLLREIAAIATSNDPAVRDASGEVALQRIYHAYKRALTTTAFRQIWWTDLLTLTLHKPWAKGKETPRLIRLLLDPKSGFEAYAGKTAGGQELLSYYQEQLWILNKLLQVFAPAAFKKGISVNGVYELQQHFNNIRDLFGVEKASHTDERSSDGSFSANKAGGTGKGPSDELPGVNKAGDAGKGTSDKDLSLSFQETNGIDKDASDLNVKDANNILAKPGEKTGRLEEVPKGIADAADPSVVVAKTPSNKTNPGKWLVNSTFSDIEKLYVKNSGLVLLWPFLPRFFSNLELTNNDGSIDASAAAKACLLLQYLAYGNDMDIFEPSLLLNKLLTGVDLFNPIDIQAVITPDERDAADHMLRAVIGNAPLWKTLSEDGLRRAYLQRDGVLSARDGHWLLQVKRETYDVILDKLPWAVTVIKLPWMENLIFVEWLSI